MPTLREVWQSCRWLAASVFFLMPLCAAEAKRTALVVGISDYEFSPRLANPRHDAASVAKALELAGFNVVQSLDEDLSGLLLALDRFYAEAESAEAALFFFAGHGLQFDGVNYLVARNAQLRGEAHLKQDAVVLQDIISAMEKRARITLVFLDACRDNPVAQKLQNSVKHKTRSAFVSRGLARMEVRNPDTLLVFAAAPGRTASDGEGSNSPFTAALLNNIGEPGVEIELMMKRVTREVVQSTNGEQTPERLSKLTSEFIFIPSTRDKGSTIPSQASSPQQSLRTDDECVSGNPPVGCLWKN